MGVVVGERESGVLQVQVVLINHVTVRKVHFDPIFGDCIRLSTCLRELDWKG